MKTYCSRTMRLALFLCQLGLVLRTQAQIPEPCITSETNRPPEYSDISVTCGTEHMDLSIYICPVYQALYNESLMALNSQHNDPSCFGTPDWSVTPPVLKFSFSINETSMRSCGNQFRTIDKVGTGAFADFSRIQIVNISGSITSFDPSAGMITYRPQILYKFSCSYPLQYILDNSMLGVSGASLAVSDNNGTFISTLSMELYENEDYKDVLNIPETGINLKTKIYVAVKATNLSDRFHLLLDRCYTTTSPYPVMNTYYDLFVGCTRDAQTKVHLNGVSQQAHFSFEAFRFVEHRNRTVSTFYLHCVTRLCEVSMCSSLMPDCTAPSSRRMKRETEGVSENTTVTSPVIIVGKQNSDFSTNVAAHGMSSENYSAPVVGVIVCIVILAILFSAMAIYFAFYIKQKRPPI